MNKTEALLERAEAVLPEVQSARAYTIVGELIEEIRKLTDPERRGAFVKHIEEQNAKIADLTKKIQGATAILS
jgi:hypothetical protein